jgi:UDP-glucuronate 4-epimerase
MGHYLLTGVAGFIASKVAGLLLSEGHTVVGIDNMDSAYDVRLKQWRLTQIQGLPGFEFHRYDITDRPAMRDLCEAGGKRKFDAIINLAARAGVRQSIEDPWAYITTNITGTLNLLELCREFDIKKMVLASSSSLYGNENPMPFREDADTDRPSSPYAASKKGAEALCHTYHHLLGIDITIFRYFTVFGPAGRPDMSLFRFVQWISEGRPVIIYGDGRQSRDFTYVDDIARGTAAGLRPMGFEIINLGSSSPVVLLDAIRTIEGLTGQKAELEFRPLHSSDVPATWANIDRAERLLNWRPQVTFESGAASLVKWYQNNREWTRMIRTELTK